MTTRELGALVGTTGPTVSRWENGVNEPDDQMKSKLAQALGCSVAYLIGEAPVMESNARLANDDDDKPEGDTVEIAVMSPEFTACCGPGITSFDVTYDSGETVTMLRTQVGRWCDGKKPYAIITDGNSMEKWGIRSGSRVVINPVEEVRDLDIVLVYYYGKLALKKVRRNRDGSIKLMAADGSLIEVSADDAAEESIFNVLGKAMSYYYEEYGRIDHGL